MLLNNYKYKPNQHITIEQGTPSYADTIGANVLSSAADFGAFLTSFSPPDPNAKDVNVYQALRDSIEHIRDNPYQSTPQKVVGALGWIGGTLPGFGLSAKAVRLGTGLLGVAAKSTLAKSLEGGLAWGLSNIPTRSVEDTNRTALGKVGKFAEDVVEGAIGELGVRKLSSFIKGAGGASTAAEETESAVELGTYPDSIIGPEFIQDEGNNVSSTISSATTNSEEIIGLKSSTSSQESLTYSMLHEAVRADELSHNDVLSGAHAESIIDELKTGLNDVINNVPDSDKPFYEALKNYRNNTDIDALHNQVSQMADGNYNKGVSSQIDTRDQYVQQFEPHNLDVSVPEEAAIRNHMDNIDSLEAFIKCKMGL